jgi:hypothetical protein
VNDLLQKNRVYLYVYLYENFLTENPNDFSAKVVSERSIGIREVAQSAVGRGGAPTTAEAMEHNVRLWLKEMSFLLMNGFSVNAEYFTANVQVRGVFDHRNDAFDPNRHSVLFRFNQGETLRKAIPNIQVQVLGPGETGIMISHVVDAKTGSVNDLITPGGILKVRGGKLKITGDHPDVGVFFESGDGGAVKVEEHDLVMNNPSQLMIHIPELTPGRYQLVIRSRFSGAALLKEPRTAVYDKILTVQ